MKKKSSPAQIARNKKAGYHYELLDFVEAGLVLTGPEVKSVRTGQVGFHDAYVIFRQGEAFLQGLHIAPYANAGYVVSEPDRERKLLLHAREIRILAAKVEQKGLTVLPLDLHFSKGRIKTGLALGRGKKMHDQRRDLKEAAEQRDLEREFSPSGTLARYPG
ncbi:MAG: SsrA-binding protein SmpB [Deltaproteobacteria bacterium]|jgi:SsrA-binding protein|nr:SsrA-binding protein SmpB [Deltaproteobacteria bacterium]